MPYNGVMEMDVINEDFTWTDVGMVIGDAKKMRDEVLVVLKS